MIHQEPFTFLTFPLTKQARDLTPSYVPMAASQRSLGPWGRELCPRLTTSRTSFLTLQTSGPLRPPRRCPGPRFCQEQMLSVGPKKMTLIPYGGLMLFTTFWPLPVILSGDLWPHLHSTKMLLSACTTAHSAQVGPKLCVGDGWQMGSICVWKHVRLEFFLP